MADCRLETLAGCELVIGGYPRFHYNAEGGHACGQSIRTGGSALQLHFPPSSTQIPSLNWRTTRLLGLPLPPGLLISIHPDTLAGSLEPGSGVLELQFRSRFRLQVKAGNRLSYTATDLVVDTVLTTEAIQSQRHQCSGQRLDAAQRGVLVGAAVIQPTGEAWLDRCLGLPDEALAVLECRLILDGVHHA